MGILLALLTAMGCGNAQWRLLYCSSCLLAMSCSASHPLCPQDVRGEEVAESDIFLADPHELSGDWVGSCSMRPDPDGIDRFSTDLHGPTLEVRVEVTDRVTILDGAQPVFEAPLYAYRRGHGCGLEGVDPGDDVELWRPQESNESYFVEIHMALPGAPEATYETTLYYLTSPLSFDFPHIFERDETGWVMGWEFSEALTFDAPDETLIILVDCAFRRAR